MTKEPINLDQATKIIAAVMGEYIPTENDSTEKQLKYINWCVKYGPDDEGWIPPITCRWFTKELPVWWWKYLDYIFKDIYRQQLVSITVAHKASLSIKELALFVVENYKEMFYEDCPNKITEQLTHTLDIVCVATCNDYQCGNKKELNMYTGKTIIPRYAEAVEVIERYREGLKK